MSAFQNDKASFHYQPNLKILICEKENQQKTQYSFNGIPVWAQLTWHSETTWWIKYPQLSKGIALIIYIRSKVFRLVLNLLHIQKSDMLVGMLRTHSRNLEASMMIG